MHEFADKIRCMKDHQKDPDFQVLGVLSRAMLRSTLLCCCDCYAVLCCAALHSTAQHLEGKFKERGKTLEYHDAKYITDYGDAKKTVVRITTYLFRR